MILPPGPFKVMVATRPVDFRKGAVSLAALVENELGLKPFSGVAYIFRSKRANRIKLLVWDGTGLVLVSKVLQTGGFCWPRVGDGVMRLTPSQASALFEGLQWTRMHAARVQKPQVAQYVARLNPFVETVVATAEKHARNSRMSASVTDLPDDVVVLKAMVIAGLEREARMQHLLDQLKRAAFGKRSEKLSADQLALALEDIEVAQSELLALAEQSEAAVGSKGARQRDKTTERASLPAHLPRIREVIMPVETECPCCGGALHCIDEDVASRLDVIPVQYRVIVTVRPKLACRKCSDGVFQAPAPKHVVPGSLPTEALIADVIVRKYADHGPFYRQAQALRRQGIEIDRGTMCNWAGRSAAWLGRITRRMKAELLSGDRLFADETVARVLAPGTGKTKTGYLWAIARDDRAHGGTDPPAVVYSYMPGRGKVWAQQLLGGYHGVVQCDGYVAYKHIEAPDRVGGAGKLAFCWAHVRRGFFDATKGGNAPVADEALRQIARLYAIEARIRGSGLEHRRAIRQAESAPLVAAMKPWLKDMLPRLPRGSGTAEAIGYALNHWNGLNRFLDDGRIELDNNTVERSMRPIALQRKNALFAGHDLGAENWAIIASLVETCKLNAIDPQAYLTDVLGRIILRGDGDPVDDLLPYNWTDSRAANLPSVTAQAA